MLNKITKNRSNSKRVITIAMLVITVVALLVYQFIDVNFKFFEFVMKIRSPKTLAIIITAIAIGTATIVFQAVIKNRIVTPCLLGMNAMYILIHVLLAFFLQSASGFISNPIVLFIIDVMIMSVVASLLYGYLFRKTKYNILYVLLVGTVLATLLTSISNAFIRVMDPNEYDVLLSSLVASFENIDIKIIAMSVGLLVVTFIYFRKDLKLLNVINLGKSQAINLGIDFDRTVKRLIVCVTILITIATALVGPISFLGLIISNIGRQLTKTYKHSHIIFITILTGIILLAVCQIIIEHVLSYSTVITVFINLIGGAYFLYLVSRKQVV